MLLNQIKKSANKPGSLLSETDGNIAVLILNKSGSVTDESGNGINR